MKKPPKLPKPRDPAAHLRSQGALRQRVIRNKKKQVKLDRVNEKARIKKEQDDE